MKISTVLFLVISMLISGAFAAPEKEKMSAEQEEMMKKMHESATPGEAHKILSSLEGNWNYTSKAWESADSKPLESKGTSTMKMILGGRFLQHETTGEAMGMAFNGTGLIGYDTVKKKYESIWADTMSTGIMRSSGEFDSKTKTLKEKGEYSTPLEEDKTGDFRSEWKLVDKNNMIFSMFGKGLKGNKEFKMLELVYKRK